MIKRALVLGSALSSLVLLGSAAAANAAPSIAAGTDGGLSANVSCVTKGVSSVSRATALSRGKTWTDAHVSYSQSACHTDTHGTYRTDCSGFVSMAWGLAGSDTTSTLPSVSTAISKSSLLPGDILDRPGVHTVLFVGWYDTAHTHANFYQEGDTATGSYASTNVSMTSYSSYTAYRYKHITN